jgi:hypothetical protein
MGTVLHTALEFVRRNYASELWTTSFPRG